MTLAEKYSSKPEPDIQRSLFVALNGRLPIVLRRWLRGWASLDACGTLHLSLQVAEYARQVQAATGQALQVLTLAQFDTSKREERPDGHDCDQPGDEIKRQSHPYEVHVAIAAHLEHDHIGLVAKRRRERRTACHHYSHQKGPRG